MKFKNLAFNSHSINFPLKIKSILFIAACMVMVCGFTPSTAYPQSLYVNSYLSSQGATPPLRIKRSPDSAPLSKGVPTVTNSASGNIYTGKSNRIDGVVTQSQINFPSGRVSDGSTVSFKGANAKGFGGSLERDIHKGVSDTNRKSLYANLYNNDGNRLDAIYSQSHIKQDNGFGFHKTSGIIDWSNSGGHGFNADLSRYEGFGKQVSLGVYTNLFTSHDGNTRVNAHASASKWLNGPFENKFDYRFGVSHNFY